MRRPSGMIAVIALSLAGAAAAQNTADLKFSYAAPPQARAISALQAWLDRDAAATRAKLARDAATDRRDAAAGGRPFHAYEGDRMWKVVTDTPRFLSLSLEAYAYTGGAHGNTAFDELVWDKATSQRRTALSFFSSKPALAVATRTAFCRQLDAARRAKRGGTGASGTSIDEFDKCISPTGQTIILGSSDRRQFDRIGFLIAPYEAGPYAEGSYEVTLPVTPAILAAVRPADRGYFALGH